MIGFLKNTAADASMPQVAPFQQSLNEMGYTERRNVAIEYYYADNHHGQLPALAADLVRRKVDVITADASSSE